MDSLVARHSQQTYEREPVEQDDLSLTIPSLSLKFAMPPISDV